MLRPTSITVKLLELSRVESGVLGNALDGVDMESETAPAKTSPARE